MNINELREKWHRDSETADWHEAAWELMRELDEARTEIVRLHNDPDHWAERAKRAESNREILFRERDELKRLNDSLARECIVLADQRNAARGDLGAMEASLKFALETNKRLKAELDDARTECARAISEYNDLARRVSSLAPATELAEAMRLNSSLSQENVRLKAERDAALAKLERIEDIL